MRALLWVLAVAPALASGFDHSGWDKVLKSAVNPLGEVDYAALKKDSAAIDAYVERLAAISPDNGEARFPTRKHELAYWLNAYNALVIQAAAQGYPVKSVRDLGFAYGFFWRRKHTLGGRQMTLRSLENDIIRARYGDARIHFAIVCASMSCPRLDRDAFQAETLDAHLDRLTRQFVSERRNVTMEEGSNTLTLSALFDWYAKDFGDARAYVLKYAGQPARKAIEALGNPKVKFHDYDWSINDPGSRRKAKSPLERELAAKGE